jgi:hypothetical protein
MRAHVEVERALGSAAAALAHAHRDAGDQSRVVDGRSTATGNVACRLRRPAAGRSADTGRVAFLLVGQAEM